ncbi:MAG: hypothetical protein ACI4XL_00885 [Bacillus sp. (in: firmicutes)]
MKKHFVLIGSLTCILLAGCSANEAAVEEKQANEATENATKETVENSAPQQSDKQAELTTETTTVTLEDLELAVGKIEEKVADTSPAGTADEQQAVFSSIQYEIEQEEFKIDQYEDELEADYQKGSIPADTYKERELTLEKLEDRLDNAEETLEINFGIDD